MIEDKRRLKQVMLNRLCTLARSTVTVEVKLVEMFCVSLSLRLAVGIAPEGIFTLTAYGQIYNTGLRPATR